MRLFLSSQENNVVAALMVALSDGYEWDPESNALLKLLHLTVSIVLGETVDYNTLLVDDISSKHGY